MLKGPKSSLDVFRGRQLQALLQHLGASSVGTKPLLLRHLKNALEIPKLRPNAAPTGDANAGPAPTLQNKETGSLRILSIDMGIRNLAYCIADVTLPTKLGSIAAARVATSDQAAGIHESRQPRQREKNNIDKNDENDDVAPSIATTTHLLPSVHVQEWKVLSLFSSAELATSSTDLFEPANLARTAHALVIDNWLPWNPDCILIERQRFRSFGGAMVLEWTLRVNMLEAMIFAVLRTLEAEHDKRAQTKTHRHLHQQLQLHMQEHDSDSINSHAFPEIHSVPPVRVGAFWLRALQQKQRQSPLTSATDHLDSHPFLLFGSVAAHDRPQSLVGAADVLSSAKEADSGGPSADVSPIESPASGKRTTPRKVRERFEKKDHIALVRSWLCATLPNAVHNTSDSSNVSGTTRNMPINLSFSHAAEATAHAFLSPRRSASGSRQKQIKLGEDMPDSEPLRKADDLADSLLQAAAWTVWESNRLLFVGCITPAEQSALEEGARIAMEAEEDESKGVPVKTRKKKPTKATP